MIADADFAHLSVGDHRIACPSAACRAKHRDRDDALSVTVKPGGGYVFHCWRCGWSGGARDATGAPAFYSRGNNLATSPIVAPARQFERRRGLDPRWLKTWEGAEKLCGTPADIYLRTRRCYMPPLDGALRFMPAAYHWPTKTTHPAMLALVTDATTNEALSLHFTFLKPDGTGKAELDKPKLMLFGHAIDNGCIRLWPDDCVTYGLGIAEGIETALSVAHQFKPMWSTIDAGHMAKFPVLEGIESLTVFADNDIRGRSAGKACLARWYAAGREVVLYRSDRGNDFNDAART